MNRLSTCAALVASLAQRAAAEGPRPWELAQSMAASFVLNNLSRWDRQSLIRGIKKVEEHKFKNPSTKPFGHKGYTRRIKDRSVPGLKFSDGQSGFHPPVESTGTSTCFPSLLALASTWDPPMAEEYGMAIGREFKGKGANVLLGPNLNVVRTARGGRNFESLSGEDPYLGGSLARAYVQGVQSQQVMAAAKNFAFDEQQRGLPNANAVVDARTAWELYYPPFESAVQAGLSGVVCPPNYINGTASCGNNKVLNQDLRQKMGFKGLVVSGWGATFWSGQRGDELTQHGLDLEMPEGTTLSEEAIFFMNKHDGTPAQDGFDTAARHLLSAIYHLRIEENEGCAGPHACREALATDQTNPAHTDLAAKVAAEAVTLLKNDGTLPLDASRVRRVLVVGKAAVSTPNMGDEAEFTADYYSGGGSTHCRAKETVTPLKAIKDRAVQAGIEVLEYTGEAVVEALAMTESVDAVLVVGAATSDSTADRRSLSLDHGVDDLISALAAVKPTAVLMQTPGAVLTPWRENVTAIANLFLGGQETAKAWAAVVFGDTSPAGRLPILFPASEADVVETREIAGHIVYKEGRNTSYRSPKFNAAFPFGHGLSYTTFDFGKPAAKVNCAVPGATNCIQLTVTNTGNRTGREVLQAYFEFPQEAKMPAKVLRGFVKTSPLTPGASEDVTFYFTRRDFSTWQLDADNWKAWPELTVRFGTSSENLPESMAVTMGTETAPQPKASLARKVAKAAEKRKQQEEQKQKREQARVRHEIVSKKDVEVVVKPYAKPMAAKPNVAEVVTTGIVKPHL